MIVISQNCGKNQNVANIKKIYKNIKNIPIYIDKLTITK